MIKNPKQYLIESERERQEYLQFITYDESAAITEGMLSSKMLRQFKFSDDNPCALSIQLRRKSRGRKRP
ncbi:hypothetical protein KKG61_07665 [bacterium]|nr:hypothetical protein [bacterium]MBU1599961.1 hypothetical protein [bacterium]MBU2462121.1 hypothetical protein [bacterium]